MQESQKRLKNLVSDKIIFGLLRKNGLEFFIEFRSFQNFF